MGLAAYYRSEAERCRQFAAKAPMLSDVSRRWLRLALEYDNLAQSLDSVAPSPPMQRQPDQQHAG